MNPIIDPDTLTEEQIQWFRNKFEELYASYIRFKPHTFAEVFESQLLLLIQIFGLEFFQQKGE